MPQSTSASAPLAIEGTTTSKLLGAVSYFFIRRRILISFVLFTAMIVDDIARGVRPHDLANFRNPMTVAGLALVVLGLVVRSWAAGILHKDVELTTVGPYRLVRNPLYLGSFMMMFGFCALIDDLRNVPILAVAMLALYGVKVRNEERWLAKLFPAQFADYARRTPRFLPRLARTDVLAHWSRAQWIHAREYQAVAAALAALVAIKVWQAVA